MIKNIERQLILTKKKLVEYAAIVLRDIHIGTRIFPILWNLTQCFIKSCQINCTRNQTFADKFAKIPQCTVDSVRICEGYLGIDFNEGLVSYSFTRADAVDNASLIRADLMEKYRSYIDTNITAIRFRQLVMKFSQNNPYRLNVNYCKFILPLSLFSIRIFPIRLSKTDRWFFDI